MKRYAIILAALASFTPSLGAADVLVDESGEFGPQPSSELFEFTFNGEEAGTSPLLDATADVAQGQVTVRVTGPEEEVVFEATTRGSMQLDGQSLAMSGRAGNYLVVVVPEQAVGTWTVRVSTEPEAWQIAVFAIPGVGMVAVGLASVLLWRRWSRARWRWFWVGAGIWTVGVILKFAWAIPLNQPVLERLEALPHNLYLAVGSFYIGLLTGVFEIGVTLVAALLWSKMAQDSGRGVSVGMGAGAFEAILIGALSVLGVLAALTMGGQIREQLLASAAPAAETTPLFWLVGPVERVTAILCHTSSRALVLLGVARRRWLWPFLAGFLIMTILDAVAGYAHLAGLMGEVSVWWIELAIAPAGLVSIPLLVWCIREWPEASAVSAVENAHP